MIRRIAKRVKNDTLLRDSAVIFAASMIVNVLNYVFQLYIGRALGPADYGVFAAVSSLLYIVSVPSAAISTSVTKFVARFFGRKETGKIKFLFFRGMKKTLMLGVVGFLVICLVSAPISSFLNIVPVSPVIILGLIFFVSIVSPVPSGTLSGIQRFRELGAVHVGSALIKLALGVALVWAGLGVDGALLAVFLGSAAGFGLSVIFIRDILKADGVRFDKNGIMSYSFPVFFSLLLINVMGNIDVVLVKHYFPEAAAGHYAAAALLAKIVFFASGAVTGVMFAKVAESDASSVKTRKMLYDSMLYVGAISFAAVVVYFVAPYFVVSMLFGAGYSEAVPLVGLFGLAMGFFALTSVLVNYNLAVRKTKFMYMLALAALVEIAMIALFHDSLLTVVKIITVAMALVFSAMLLFTKEDIL